MHKLQCTYKSKEIGLPGFQFHKDLCGKTLKQLQTRNRSQGTCVKTTTVRPKQSL